MFDYPSSVYQDRDIYEIIEQASADELSVLVELLCSNSACTISSDCREVDAIVHQIQLLGGNSVSNFLRGSGVFYYEIVCKIATKLDIDLDDCAEIGAIEWQISEHFLRETLQQMPKKERSSFYKQLQEESKKKALSFDIAHTLTEDFGRWIFLRLVLTHILLRLGIAGAAKISTAFIVTLLAGPIGWSASVIWLAIDLVGPAYSTLIPLVILLATIRTRLSLGISQIQTGS